MAKVNTDKPKEIKQLAKRIKELRIKKGFESQEKFAYEHHYTLSHYSKLERGVDLRFSSLVKVCKALGVSVQEFFDGYK